MPRRDRDQVSMRRIAFTVEGSDPGLLASGFLGCALRIVRGVVLARSAKREADD